MQITKKEKGKTRMRGAGSGGMREDLLMAPNHRGGTHPVLSSYARRSQKTNQTIKEDKSWSERPAYPDNSVGWNNHDVNSLFDPRWAA